jgi:hypothetical protein
MIAGIGCRRAAWRLEVLCHVGVSTSAIDRWMDEVAEEWPSADAMVEERNRRQLITAGHVDGFFPRGANGTCVLVWRDEPGRIIATDEVDAEQAAQVKPFLLRLKRRGLQIQTCDIDHRQALRKAIQAVDPQARIQYDSFHIIQTIWQKLWSDVRAHRQEVEARSPEVRTEWSRDT